MNRDEKKQATRLKILQTAEKLFRSDGYDAVSTRQIAKVANIGVGTVFAHFPDKHQLTKALFHEKLEKHLSSRTVTKEPASALDWFLDQSALLYALYNEDKAFSKALLQSSIFEFDYFEQQMQAYVRELAAQLVNDRHTEQNAATLAQAWFGAYMFELTRGLSDVTSEPAQWLNGLKAQCEALLRLMD